MNLIKFPKRCNLTAQRRLRNMLASHLDTKTKDIAMRAIALDLAPGTMEFDEFVKAEMDAEAQDWMKNLGLKDPE
jgi:hypothetical protein